MNGWKNLLTGVAKAVVSGLSSPKQGGSQRGGTSSRPPGSRRKPSSGKPAAPRPAPRPADSRPTGGKPTGGKATNGQPTNGQATKPGSGGYPGDFTGSVRSEYSPELDGDPDPGEIVWTWVPYEEDFSQGKDRPVLLVGRDGRWLLGIMLTSKDHSRDAADEAHWGRHWLDVGTGPWDAQGRDSEVRLDRVIRIDPTAVRREGAIMGRKLFDQVVTAMGKF
jgi:hypothetical protein